MKKKGPRLGPRQYCPAKKVKLKVFPFLFGGWAVSENLATAWWYWDGGLSASLFEQAKPKPQLTSYTDYKPPDLRSDHTRIFGKAKPKKSKAASFPSIFLFHESFQAAATQLKVHDRHFVRLKRPHVSRVHFAREIRSILVPYNHSYRMIAHPRS